MMFFTGSSQPIYSEDLQAMCKRATASANGRLGLFWGSYRPSRLPTVNGRSSLDSGSQSNVLGPVCIHAALIMSAAFSAIMMVGAFVFPRTTLGITEASATRRPSKPNTRSLGSTTLPIAQVVVG